MQGTAKFELESEKIGKVDLLSALTMMQNGQSMMSNTNAQMVAVTEVLVLTYGKDLVIEQMQKEMAFMAGKVEGLETALTKQQNINVHSNLTANAQAQSLSQAQVQVQIQLKQHLHELESSLDFLHFD